VNRRGMMFCKRYLRRYLPSTDFADTMWDSPGSRSRGLAMNRKARDVLVANHIIKENEYEAVMILDRLPKGVDDLDRRYGTPAPAFTPEQMAKLREWEAAAWAKHVANPKPRRAPDLTRSLSLLRSYKRRQAKSFFKPAAQKSIDDASTALGRAIPMAWQKVLRISNGGRIDNCCLAEEHSCFFTKVEQLTKSNRESVAYYRQMGRELPATYIEIMTTEFGDSVWLDTKRQTKDGDCRVALLSHETTEEDREWSSIAEFLEELLTATEE